MQEEPGNDARLWWALRCLSVPAAAIALMKTAAPAPRVAVAIMTMANADMCAGPDAADMCATTDDIATADMYAGADAADMGADANTISVRGRRAQQGQGKNRSDQCFHGRFLG